MQKRSFKSAYRQHTHSTSDFPQRRGAGSQAFARALMKHPLQQLTPSTGSSVKYVSPLCAVFTHDSYAHVLTLLNFSIPVRFLPTDTSNCPPPCPHPMARRGCTTGTPTPGHFSAVAADGRHSFARTSDGLRDPCRRTSKRFTMTKVNSGSHYVTCAWKSSKMLWPSRYTAMHRQMIAKPVLQGCMLQTIREPCGFDMVQKKLSPQHRLSSIDVSVYIAIRSRCDAQAISNVT